MRAGVHPDGRDALDGRRADPAAMLLDGAERCGLRHSSEKPEGHAPV